MKELTVFQCTSNKLLKITILKTIAFTASSNKKNCDKYGKPTKMKIIQQNEQKLKEI